MIRFSSRIAKIVGGQHRLVDAQYDVVKPGSLAECALVRRADGDGRSFERFRRAELQ
jgi:hypothetical protein